jgi:methylmalonyl-CoA mutase N-terminal domain/subunit
MEALAAVLGGTQSLHTNAYDEALALPSEESARIALRTQQIIAEESGAAETIDPLGGAFLVEKLTSDIEERVFAELARIDALGGALAGIERGYQQRAIEDSAYRYQREIEAGERVVVGVNRYRTDGDEAKITTLKVDESVAARQRDRLAAVRASRDPARTERLRADLRTAALGTANLMPPIVAAVEGDVTLGEICADLRAAFGTYVPADRG